MALTLKSAVWFVWVLAMTEVKITSSQQEPNTTNTSQADLSKLTLVLGTLLPTMQHLSFDKELMNRTCPQLWDKEKVFNGAAGFLGSLEEIKNLCPDSEPLCGVAKWMSAYLCNASQGLGDTRTPATPPPMKDFADLNDVATLCSRLASNDLEKSILAAVQANERLKSPQSVNFFPQLQKFIADSCPASCVGKNQRACQIILQGLRTVVAWEEIKNKVTSRTEDGTPQTGLAPVSQETTVKPQKVNESTTVPKTTENNQQTPDTKPDTSVNKTPAEIADNPPALVETTTIPILDISKEDIQEIQPEDVPETKPDEMEANEDYEDKDDGDVGMEESNEVSKNGNGGQQNTVSDKTAKETEVLYVEEPQDTHFIIYFLVCLVLVVLCYLLYQRRTRVVALIVEGRGPQRRRSNPRARTSSASYKRLDNNLEEVVTSSRAVKSSNVIY